MYNFHKVLFVSLFIILLSSFLVAQDYGTGLVVDVPQVDPSAITLDGFDDEAEWADAAILVLDDAWTWDGGWNNDYGAEIDIGYEAKILYSTDTVFVHVLFEDYQEFFWGFPGDPWGGESIYFGVDGTHAGDDQTNEDWSGWPLNAPDLGPTTYKVNGTYGITLDWGYWNISPVDSGWVRGEVWVDEENYVWTVEMAIYVPQVEAGAQIGFSVGGSTAHPDTANYELYGECNYAYFAYHPGGNAGRIMQDAGSFSTLNFVKEYGTGLVVDVPQVDPSDLTLDGFDDEAEWADAAILVLDDAWTWDGGWNNDYGAEIDIGYEAKILYSTDTVFVHVLFEDYQEFFWGFPGDPWGGESIYFGVDGTHAGDDQINGDWSGWPLNAPDLGPTTYKVNGTYGITLDWGYWNISPVDSGWVRGEVWVDEENYVWTVEMAIYVPQVEAGAQIGFSVGGSTAHPDTANYELYGECNYAYFAYHPGGNAGRIMQDAGSFSTLNFVGGSLAIDDLEMTAMPKEFLLRQNYPNPFNPMTKIKYELKRNAYVQLIVYNSLGQTVGQLVDGRMNSGAHEITWNAENQPSGIYFYRLSVDGQVVSTKKALLVK